jgi:RNase P subunit RPR2
MECENKKIMRGHLISIDAPKKVLPKYREEFYKTKYYNIILGKKFVSFKRNKQLVRFEWQEIKRFFLKDCHTFVIDARSPRKRFYFKIV